MSCAHRHFCESVTAFGVVILTNNSSKNPNQLFTQGKQPNAAHKIAIAMKE
jgi:hypothetical protein